MKKINWIAFLCVAFATMFFNACGDSVDADEQPVAEVDESSSSVKASSSVKGKSSSSSVMYSSSSVKSSSSKALYPESFKPDDKEYPYAGIPRIVIETEKRQAIKDRETEIPAKLQIWGKKEAESEIMDLTIRGRGNTSWKLMPKKSYKIEFTKKQSMLGMPNDKDWALIANYVDKTLMRNYIAYRLSAALGAYYAPRCEFAELYLNGEYLGVYLVTETIKISKDRVNIPKDDYSYIVEVDGKYRSGEQVIFSDVLTTNNKGKAFRVHDPKNATASILDTVRNHIQNFEMYLKTIDVEKDNNVGEWIDVDESIKHYWVQELSKNPDAAFYTSVYFSWRKGEKIKMGPVWDFDLAFGNHYEEEYNLPEKWYIQIYWYQSLLKDDSYKHSVFEMWNDSRVLFESVVDLVDMTYAKLKHVASNNFKRWNILGETEGMFNKSYDSYDDAVDDLKKWIKERMFWIDSQMQN